ncbi:MAG: hypothetical protein WAW10_08065, partial [Gallionella sp.]
EQFAHQHRERNRTEQIGAHNKKQYQHFEYLKMRAADFTPFLIAPDKLNAQKSPHRAPRNPLVAVVLIQKGGRARQDRKGQTARRKDEVQGVGVAEISVAVSA